MNNEDAVLELLERSDVAKLLNIAPDTVRYHADAGNLTIFAITPRGVRLFHIDDVEEFRDERKFKKETGL